MAVLLEQDAPGKMGHHRTDRTQAVSGCRREPAAPDNDGQDAAPRIVMKVNPFAEPPRSTDIPRFRCRWHAQPLPAGRHSRRQLSFRHGAVVVLQT